MASLPSLFLAHGAPDLPLSNHVAKRFLMGIAAGLPRPKAILIISAHWEAETATMGSASSPETVYDFGGFDPRLYQLQYPAQTDPVLIERVAALLSNAGQIVNRDPQRGYDHGVWVPLILTYPAADIPVVQLSLIQGGDGERHLDLGRALAPLRDEGVLIVGSGATVHNLRALAREGSPVPVWATSFDRDIQRSVEAGDHASLVSAPVATEVGRHAHPTPEHFMPLLVALGAGGNGSVGRSIHQSFSYGSISMACFAFGSEAEVSLLEQEVVQ